MNKKKTITISTFLYKNYGGLLQGYALQKYLRNKGLFKVQNLDFFTKEHVKDSKVFNLYGSIKSRMSQIFFSLIRYNDLSLRKKRSINFKKQFFQMTSRYHNEQDFIKSPPKSDIYITGSDQVFNPNGKYKNVFFLNFKSKNSKKIAYAASFGGDDFSHSFIKDAITILKSFNHISCRENSGSIYLSNKMNKQIDWVVDPVFLLNNNEWKKIAVEMKLNQNFILIYALASEEKLISIAKKIKGDSDLKIYCIRYNTRSFLNLDKVIYSCGPREFLTYFLNAKYVVTDSFHGTAFSLIFKKPFYTFISRPNVSTRIYSLLSRLKLSNRIINNNNLNSFEPEMNLDDSYVFELDKFINSSKNFIDNKIINENL